MRCLLLLPECLILCITGLSQNVGIGSTTPIDKLTVQTSSNSYGITHTNGTVRLSTYVNPGSGWLGAATNHPVSFITNGTPRMTIETNGNVGIGTTTPNRKLTVSTTGSDYGIVQTNGTISVGTYAGNSANAPEGGWYGTLSGHPLYFFTAASEPQATLTTNGFLGIGTTTPFGALDVRRVPSSLGTAFFQGTTYGSVFHYSTTEDIYIRGGKAGSNVLINDIAALGKVGIGTDAPADKLTVRTPSNNYGFTHTDGTVTVGSYVGGGAGWFGTKTNQPLYFFTNNGNARLEIQTDGQVFINSALTLRNAIILKPVDGSGGEWHQYHAASGNLNFAFNGNVEAYVPWHSGEWVEVSDGRLKENISSYKPVLADIKNLSISTFNYKSNPPGIRSFGLIAQNVAKYFPEIISERKDKDGNTYLGIAYGKTGVLALKAIQEQQDIIEELKKRTMI